MKLLLPTGIAFILLSCSKSSSPNNPPTPTSPTSNLVTSLIAFNPVNHSKSTEKFKYDSSKNLVILHVRSDDTSQGIVYLDSGSWYFTIDPISNLPVSYTTVFKKSDYTANDVQVHNLYYDNQKRVILDSLISGTNQQGGLWSPSSFHYIYVNNLILGYDYGKNNGDPVIQNGYIDSMVLNNGNLVRKAGYSISNGSLTADFIYTVNGYSIDMNPLYTPDLSNSLGAYLVHENLFDGLSKNLTTDGGGNWVKDSIGRVVSGPGSFGDQFIFIYQ